MIELRRVTDDGLGARVTIRDEEREVVDEPVRYLCAVCEAVITTPGAGIEVDGKHVHRQVNPAGLRFTIGCFGDAPGAQVFGDPTTEHSWFAGFYWSYAGCGSCAEHLGWRFDSAASDVAGAGGFFGLILDRLIES